MREIRRAHEGDLTAWSTMRAELSPDHAAQDHLVDLKATFGTSGFAGWIALEDGIPVAFAEACIRPFANGCDSRPVAFLEGIWIDERHRRSGIGRSLVRAVEDWAKELGIGELGSDTELHNMLSQQCHEAWGFEETERVVYFRKKL